MLSDVSNQVREMNLKLGEKDTKIDKLQRIVESLSASMHHMKLDYEKNENSRKQLFNMVQKLKGSMRVYCRVKPLDTHIQEPQQ